METMRRQRRNHSPEFKARVALEALKGIKPIHEIAADNEIHPVQISQWKKELQERMSELFERKNARDPDAENEQRRIAQLERTVGRPIDEAWVERDWLQKKSKELGID
jgi:transposase